MSAYAVPFAIPKQPRSLLQPTRRDFATTAGDDFTIEITVYPTDVDTDPYDVTDAEASFTVYDDSGRSVVTVDGTVVDAGAGRIDIEVDGSDTTEMAGRYSFSVSVEFADGTSTVIHGAAHISSRSGVEAVSGSVASTSSGVLDLTEVTIQTATITTAEIGALTVTGGFVGESSGSFGGNLSVTGNITATGDISVGDDLSVTGDATVSGSFTVTGDLTGANATLSEVDLAAWRLQDTFSAEGATNLDTAPISVRLQLPRVTGANAPTGNRSTMPLRIQSDNIKSTTTTGGYGTIRHWDYLITLGQNGKAAADSWAGARVGMTIAIQERSPPVEQTLPVNPSRSQPATNALWLSQAHSQNRGGTGLNRAECRGSTFNLYSIMTLDGADYLNVTRQMELGFQMRASGSTRAYRAIATPIIQVDGPIPPGPFTVVGATRKRLATPGYVSGFLAGGRQGVGGVDPYLGIAFEHSASSADVAPKALAGVSLREVEYLRNAIEWAGGDISGGTKGDPGTGRLRLGTAFFEQTTAGLSIDVCGYEGSAAGDIISLSTKDTIIYPELGTFLEDTHDGHGVYRARSRAATAINSVEVVVPPVSKTDPGAAKTALEIKPHTQTTPVYVFNVTGTATTTTHPIPSVNSSDDFCVGMYLEYMSGVCKGERKIITAYNATTSVLTTAAFSQVPTLTNDAITNGNFTTNPLTGAEGVTTAGWSWFTDGAAPQPTWVSHQVSIAGDGTDAAGIDQQITITALVDYILGFVFKGANGFTVKLGSTKGGAEYHETQIDPDPPEDDEDLTTPQIAQVRFSIPSGTSVWLRLSTTGAGAAIIDRVTCQAVSDADTAYGVRAKIVTPTLDLAHTWTHRDTLALQGSGGPMTVGGTADVAGNFSVATSKMTVAAATGNTAIAGTLAVTGATTMAGVTASGTVTAAAVVPSGSSVPTNGMYLPAANTLGWGINSAAEVQLTSAAFSPAASDGNALGTTALPWSDLFLASGGVLNFAAGDVTVTHSTGALAFGVASASFTGTLDAAGNFSVATSKFTVAAASGNTSIGGTLAVTGASTLSGAVSATAAGTGLAVTNNATIGGTLGVTGTTTAAAVTASGAITANGAGTGLAVTNNATIGGTLGITGTTTAAAVTASGTVTGATFVPSSASAPTNGMYLPAANTLGWAVSSAAEVQLTSTALSPAANDGNALGTTSLSWADLFLASGGVINFNAGNATITHSAGALAFGVTTASFTGTLDSAGNFTVATSKFTVAAATGNTSVAGTLAVTGTSTLTGAVTTTTSLTSNASGGNLTALAGTMIYAAAADATNTRITIDAAATNPYVQFRRYDGTYASPTAVASAAALGTIGWRGYQGSAMSGERAYLEAVAAEAWSGSAQGAHIDFGTTAAGATSNATRKMRLTSAGQLLIGTTTSSAELTVTGNVWWSGYSLASVGNALTATGTTRTDALQLAKEYNRLTTTAAGTGVILPTGVIGMAIVLFNAGANVAKVYANGSETIDGTAGSTGVNLTNGNRCVYIFMASNTWISAQLGAVSA
jgi:hypothetical protein